MPSSRYDLIPLVLNIVTTYKPKSIVDVGIGFGKWGVLFREYLDIWQTDKPYKERKTLIYGIEAFAEYENPIWQVYDQIFVKDILTILPLLNQLGKFDLLFLGDIIEHFTKEEGKRILTEIEYDKIIVITPEVVSEQGAVYNNAFEIHKSSWSQEDFPGFNHYILNNQQIFYN